LLCRVHIEAPPPARSIEGRDPQKNVLILLEEKIRRAQKQKSGEHFSAGHASEANGGEAITFTDFENRCELGTVKTPRQNWTATPQQSFLFVAVAKFIRS